MASESSTPSPSSTSDQQQQQQQQQTPPQQQGNLYLFTFLATLLVLLLISCSIVFRSFVLRRRYQRRLQEALASGGVLAPRTQGSHRKRFRTRPKFFDVWLSEGGEIWEDIMPVALSHIKPKRRPNAISEPGPLQSLSNSPNQFQLQTGRQRLTSLTRGFFTRSHLAPVPRLNIFDSEPSSPTTPMSPTVPMTPLDEKTDSLGGGSSALFQVSVLVAMPSPNRYTDEPSEELPEVVWGVTRLPCKIPPMTEQLRA